MRAHTLFQGIDIDEVTTFQARKSDSFAKVKIRAHNRRLPACITSVLSKEP